MDKGGRLCQNTLYALWKYELIKKIYNVWCLLWPSLRGYALLVYHIVSFTITQAARQIQGKEMKISIPLTSVLVSWRRRARGNWGDSSVSKVFPEQTRGPEFQPQNPQKHVDIVVSTWNPNTGEVENGVWWFKYVWPIGSGTVWRCSLAGRSVSL